MSASPIASREAALRIALAARALDGLDVKALVGALLEKLEPPLTEAKLAKLTVEDLRAILAGDFAEQGCHVGVDNETLKDAIRLLWGQGVEHADFPVVEAYTDGDMPGSIRVAVAANRGENLDGHFGSCDRFLIYQVGQEAIRLIDVRSTAEADGAEDKNASRSALINDCQLVYVQSIGGPAAATRGDAHRRLGTEDVPSQDTQCQGEEHPQQDEVAQAQEREGMGPATLTGNSCAPDGLAGGGGLQHGMIL